MNSLKSLTFIPAPLKTPHNPTFYRRERLLQRLQEQLQLLKDLNRPGIAGGIFV